MTNSQIILTETGKKKIEDELKELKENKMPEIIQKIEQAKELGDLSENAEYHDAKDQQGMFAARIAEIEEILKKAIVQEESTDKDKISIGCTFEVEDLNGNKKEYTLVGFNEADPVNGKISNESPIGQAFINKRVGDDVEFKAPMGLVKYKVLKIK